MTGTKQDPTVAGVLLAAGQGERFGQENKLLAEIGDRAVVVHAVDTLVEAELSPVVVVVGDDCERVRAAVDDRPVEPVCNPDYDRGQSTSLRAGIERVSGRADAAVIALGDMPAVTPTTVRALVAAYRTGTGDLLAAANDGQRGNPVLFDAAYFPTLLDIDGDVGGRDLVRDTGTLVETDDPAVCWDIDHVSDLLTLRERMAGDPTQE